jgi:hypothetical protein
MCRIAKPGWNESRATAELGLQHGWWSSARMWLSSTSVKLLTDYKVAFTVIFTLQLRLKRPRLTLATDVLYLAALRSSPPIHS